LAQQSNTVIQKIWTLEIFYGLMLAILSFVYIKKGNWKDNSF